MLFSVGRVSGTLRAVLWWWVGTSLMGLLAVEEEHPQQNIIMTVKLNHGGCLRETINRPCSLLFYTYTHKQAAREQSTTKNSDNSGLKCFSIGFYLKMQFFSLIFINVTLCIIWNTECPLERVDTNAERKQQSYFFLGLLQVSEWTVIFCT